MVERPDAILIAGPTASGKSKYALDLAERWYGEIVNTDSMQIYPVLDILTARPDAGDLKQVPHHLYGFASLDEPYSVARWLKDATSVAEEIWTAGKIPVFVGGTGLYFKGLDEGLTKIPEIPNAIRSDIRQRLICDGSEVLYEQLLALDAEGAAQLRPSDGQRIARALEVITATGQPLSLFQRAPMAPSFLAGKNVMRTILMPERDVLHDRINRRADWMLEDGALGEVERLLALNLPEEATVMKAIGVKQLRNYIYGEYSLNHAKTLIKAATRQYAKRQSTWFRGQFQKKWDFFAI